MSKPSLTENERKANRTLNERKRKQRIKNDPVSREEFLRKDRERYARKKAAGLIKTRSEMNPQMLRNLRRKNSTSANAYYRRKKMSATCESDSRTEGSVDTCSVQTTEEVGCDVIMETHNDEEYLTPIPPLRDHKAAERSRLYRQRHRDEINERRRYTRLRQKKLHQTLSANVLNTDEIDRNTAETSNSNDQPTLEFKGNTYKQQRYYERHKEEINKRRRENRQRQKSLPIHAIYVQSNADSMDQITEATSYDQQSVNSSNDDIFSNDSNTQHFGQIQIDRDQITPTGKQTSEGTSVKMPDYVWKSQLNHHFGRSGSISDTQMTVKPLASTSQAIPATSTRHFVPHLVDESDEVDLLFKSYAKTFRKLTLQQQADVKIEMATLFANAELRNNYLVRPLTSNLQSASSSDMTEATSILTKVEISEVADTTED